MKIGDINGLPLFDSIQEAEMIAQELGCEGYHEHEYEGQIGYMPCYEHDAVLDAIEDKAEYLEDLIEDYEITYVREVTDPNEVSERYLRKLAKLNLNKDAFYTIVSKPNEPSVLDLPWRRFRYIYVPGEGSPDLVERSRDFCVRMMTGKQLVFRYEDFMDLSLQIEAQDPERKIIPRPKDSGPVDIWTWKGGAGCKHRILELWLEPKGYIYNDAKRALSESEGNMPADGQSGQINLPPNYHTGPRDAFAKVDEKGNIVKSDKAPKSDTPNRSPKGEGSAEGKADTTRSAKVSERVEKILKDKADDFNEKNKDKLGYGVDVGMLKSIYQRGAGAYNTSHSPEVKSAEQWALARVNAFLYLVKNGKPENPKYTTDYDLLPKDHPKSKDEFGYDISGLSPYTETTGSTIVEDFIDKKPYERKDDYLQRCMGSDKMVGEYPDEKQRYAVCISDYESFSKESKRVILVDIDDTIVKRGDKPIMKTLEYIDAKKDKYRIVIVSGRPNSRLEETKKMLDDVGVYYDEIYLQDFNENTSGEVGKKFKEYKAKKLIASGYEVIEGIDNDEETLGVYDSMGIHAINPKDLDLTYQPIGFSNGYAVFEDKESALEYSEFCGCGGMIEQVQYMGKRMYQSCSTKKSQFSQAFSANEEKRIIYTPVMLPNRLIPRIDEFGKKYFVQFKPESIEKMAYKYLKQKRTDKVNYEHTDQKLEDVYMVESWIIGSENDKAYNYFSPEQVPIGSWMAGFKVDSDDVWNNYVKAGKVKGVSLQGNFLYIN
jgi:hypothetical protein